MLKYKKLINNDFNNVDIKRNVDLFICDPPYGNIVGDKYDKLDKDQLYHFLISMLNWMEKFSIPGTSAYIFGGTGKYKDRPFFKFLYSLESETKWRIANVITWAKRRGYGTQKNWMYAREEIAFLVYDSKHPNYFNVPYRDEERSEAWLKRLSQKDIKYQPKTNKMRYSNVIYDINELFRNKFITAEKPEKLYDLLIRTSCPKGGLVVDPMCGSGTTAVVCESIGSINYNCIEMDKEVFDIMIKRIGKK